MILGTDTKAASLFVIFCLFKKAICAIPHGLCFVYCSVSGIVSALTGAND